MNIRCMKALVTATAFAGFGIAPAALLAQEPNPNVTIRERPRPDFDALGLRAGNYLILPEIEVSGVYDDNIFADEDDEESDFITRFQPRVSAESNFVRHRLDLLLRGDIGRYIDFDSENFENFQGVLDGTLDIRRNTSLDASINGGRFSENRDDPEDTGVGDRTVYYSYGGDLALSQTFNRLNVTLGGSAQRDSYADVDAGGMTITNEDRDETDYDATARVGYLVSPRINVFTEGRYFIKDRDAEPGDVIDGDVVAFDRDFDGWEARLGAAVDITSLIFGQAYVGFLSASFDDPAFDDVDGPSYGVDLTWNVTTLTTLSLSGDRDFEPTQTNGASSRLRSTVRFSADHELLRNTIVGGTLGWVQDEFEGIDRTDDRLEAGANITYLINRYLAIRGDYRFSTRSSDGDQATNDFDRNQFSLGFSAQL